MSPASPCTRARDIPKIGVISGATSMAPMMIAPLFIASPNDARPAETPIMM